MDNNKYITYEELTDYAVVAKGSGVRSVITLPEIGDSQYIGYNVSSMHVRVSGEANSTTINYTVYDGSSPYTYPSQYFARVLYNCNHISTPIGLIVTIDGTNMAKIVSYTNALTGTITLDTPLSSSVINNQPLKYVNVISNVASGIASCAFGKETRATGNYSFVFGYNSYGEEDGNYIRTLGVGSLAFGTTDGLYDSIIQTGPNAYGALAMGSVTDNQASIVANGMGSIAAGSCAYEQSSIFAGDSGAFAMGHASWDSSISAITKGSFAFGNVESRGNIKASGKGSSALGDAYHMSITAYGRGSHARGAGPDTSFMDGGITASGIGSTSIGYIYYDSSWRDASISIYNEAKGYGSFASGTGVITNNFDEHALGFCNVSHGSTATYWNGNGTTTLLSVGVGSSPNARANAFEIMQNGDVYVKGLGGYDGTNAGTNGILTLQQVIANL